jgi:hypothetical protein
MPPLRRGGFRVRCKVIEPERDAFNVIPEAQVGLIKSIASVIGLFALAFDADDASDGTDPGPH